MVGKIVRAPARPSTTAPALLVGKVLFIDLILYSITTIGGNNWGLVGIDEVPDLLFLISMQTKTTSSIITVVR